MPKYWLNVDRPSGTAVLHQDGCPELRLESETGLKGTDEMSRDGGWFSFDSFLDAKGFVRRELEPLGVQRVKSCDRCH